MWRAQVYRENLLISNLFDANRSQIDRKSIVNRSQKKTQKNVIASAHFDVVFS